MAAVAAPATPQRPLPGGFMSTPVQALPAPSTIFAANAATLRQTLPPATSEPPSSTTTHSVPSSVERAARTINDTLAQEARFPELESYITQGISGEYELPTSPAWHPFQTLRRHDLPQRLLEQANQTGLGLEFGIFAPLGHAWMTLDGSLYLWDYTLPNPELIGWEENQYPITAVKLVQPKPGVFVKEIEHVIVVVTSQDMLLLGVAVQNSPSGKSITLYNTRMSISVRGLNVKIIEASRRTGRIFFSSNSSEDIYEFRYQSEEGWFTGKTSCIRHTRGQLGFVQDNVSALTKYFAPAPANKTIRRMTIDDSRNLLYTLSNTSEIKVWLIRDDVSLGLTRPLANLLQSTGHFTPRTELLTGKNVSLVSISAIPSREASKLSLMALTNTGCRLYMSVTRGYGYTADANNAPSSMQVLHIRFPPRDPTAPPPPVSSVVTTVQQNVDTNSRYLDNLHNGVRFPPGYFFALRRSPNNAFDQLFCAGPDAARLKNPQDPSQLSQRSGEFGIWVDLPGDLYEIEPTKASGEFGATSTPLGFGNEQALQFDEPDAEIAIVTHMGIQTIRRRRLVDIFAGMLRYGSSDQEGREGDIKRFIRTYGRGETAATALAVACGQGIDVTSDSRLTNITDPDVLEGARKIFIEHGGKPEFNANALPDKTASPTDAVRPSPRHEGIALYISRLVRSIWRVTVLKSQAKPGEVPTLLAGVKTPKLRQIQHDLSALQDFLNHNQSFIEGLTGPQASGAASSRQEELAIQGEHRALVSLTKLISSIIEGISFVLVLFEEPIDSIVGSLGEESKRQVKELTFESLFVSNLGRDLAKELVKAIVNINISNGSNVETIAEALRRRCGTFCSADDVVTFKAQEQVKRASEAGWQSETGRALLNESQRLFTKVAASLNMEHLEWATSRYVHMSFFAGAIELCLAVANERDRAKRAQGWLKDGLPAGDDRQPAFEARKSCYDLIFAIIQSLDTQTPLSDSADDHSLAVAVKRRNEAYEVVNSSEDAVFHTCLYDWYVSIGQADRLLDLEIHFVVDYLRRRAQDDRAHADLLWRYHAHRGDYLQAASVQHDLARGYFELSLEERIQYLSHARTNANTRYSVHLDSRQNRQQLLREISDRLDVANIQDDILQRMKSESRLTGERRAQVLAALNGPILPIDELFNQYADQAGYHDICILIYQVADHRNPADIKSSWQNLIDQTDRTITITEGPAALPWEHIGSKIRDLGRRLNASSSPATFPLHVLLPMIERYAIEPGREHKPPVKWAIDTFLDLDVPPETLHPILEHLWYGNEHPFQGSKRRALAAQMVYVLGRWVAESERRGDRVLGGGEEQAAVILESLAAVVREGGLQQEDKFAAENLAARVQRSLL